MARKPAPTKAHEPEASPAEKAFGAAAEFVEHLGTLAYHARLYQPGGDWKQVGATYALAFVAWFDLTHLLTRAVRTDARRVYPPGAPSIKLGKTRAKPTVIEAVDDELGTYFRNAVYFGRHHPLEPDRVRVGNEAKARATARQVEQGKPAEPLGWGVDFDELMKHETRAAVRERLGIKTKWDALELMQREWQAQSPERAETALILLRCGSIDFDDLRTQLGREAEAVIAAERKPDAAAIAVPAELLAKMDAVIASAKPKSKTRRTRKPALVKPVRPLTPIQNRTLLVVARHHGNFAAAAAEMDKDRKTVEENWNAATAKMQRDGGQPSRSVNASRLSTDARGQVNAKPRGG